MNNFEDAVILGVAGNFAGHLQQAGEADDFALYGDVNANKPQALFPIYVPRIEHPYLSAYPLNANTTKLPNDILNLQIEPELALVCDVTYEDSQVSQLTPTHFGAFNDCSIRRPDANKISEKKNWGAASKGLATQLIALKQLTPNSDIDRFRIASFHKRGEQLFAYGEDCAVHEYSYFYNDLLEWIRDQMNHQVDRGPMENIHALLKQANFPSQLVVAVGATRYTDYGEQHFLERGDESIVVVYDSSLYQPHDVFGMVQKAQFGTIGLSYVCQKVV
ncbi:DUF5718 family protein [Vibrio spartinae]|uniref:Uncharacterized protein n=1 Tax=Vibrio spartinae TaxID=1918945 RepID=A0A1N6MAU7_9VIBR|nr:DUF5718 family protein [Vibrio spartinae]QMV13782.1 hypothetical protein Vspart_01024 [Vibrio spartinae]SIO96578.1 hypothetical protein VSP9026_04381 [Vibrio spartinae]